MVDTTGELLAALLRSTLNTIGELFSSNAYVSLIVSLFISLNLNWVPLHEQIVVIREVYIMFLNRSTVLQQKYLTKMKSFKLNLRPKSITTLASCSNWLLHEISQYVKIVGTLLTRALHGLESWTHTRPNQQLLNLHQTQTHKSQPEPNPYPYPNPKNTKFLLLR